MVGPTQRPSANRERDKASMGPLFNYAAAALEMGTWRSVHQADWDAEKLTWQRSAGRGPARFLVNLAAPYRAQGSPAEKAALLMAWAALHVVRGLDQREKG